MVLLQGSIWCNGKLMVVQSLSFFFFFLPLNYEHIERIQASVFCIPNACSVISKLGSASLFIYYYFINTVTIRNIA